MASLARSIARSRDLRSNARGERLQKTIRERDGDGRARARTRARRRRGARARARAGDERAQRNAVGETERLRANVALAIAAMTFNVREVEAREMKATLGAGDGAFLERAYSDLKYAGVVDVVRGRADGREVVRVTYDDERMDFASVMRAYWMRAEPTQTNGQFSEIGSEYAPVVYVGNDAERAIAEDGQRNLEQSGFYGEGKPCVVPVLDGPPKSFEAAPESERDGLRKNPKKYEKMRAKRDKRFNELWGYVQFCKDRVCGYVRFAPRCVGTCLNTFPEYNARNSGVPSLDGPGVKITAK